MNTTRRSALLLAGVFVLSACSSTSDFFLGKDNRPAPKPLPAASGSAGATLLWKHKLGSGGADEGLALKPAIWGGRIYAVSANGRLYAYNSDGSTAWQQKLGNNISAGVAVDRRNVYLGTSNGDLLALSAADGETEWRAPLSSLMLAALPWLWTVYLHHYRPQPAAKPPSIREQLLARAMADLAALRDNAAQYRCRADGERIGLLLEQLCNHSETYLENLRGDDERIRANRPLLTVYLPELTYISLLYLQLPAAELGEHNRRQLLQLVGDTHDLVQNGHQHQRARTLRDLETRMEVLRERLHPPATEPRQNEAKN